ncbi:MAG TPA: TRAP transporter large permease subunit [Aliidongia sp.]|uniref:TRAP transporter large permease n=1 Tax=Aliidongia sp. TaxID=1914230 RepID=UPI002DDD3658|nr:TRAP transporter large permease subunit [Aliidongia sp.]HEV2676059.1 TRAP transporter large permease subunit [Aliidongia sp.]
MPRPLAARVAHGGILVLRRTVETVAALTLLADLIVVCLSVIYRYVFHDPLQWSDEVARGLLVLLAFTGGAAALAERRHVGIQALLSRLSPDRRALVEAAGLWVVFAVALSLTWYAWDYSRTASEQITSYGLPQNLFIYPMVLGGAAMSLFAAGHLLECPGRPRALALAGLCLIVAVLLAWQLYLPDFAPSPLAMLLIGFALCLAGGVPIAFALCLGALAFLATDGDIPLAVFAQQAAAGIDNFVLLAIPFFVLTGLAMEVNGMSVRLIELLRRMVGERPGGLGIVTVLSMVLFSGISGSKLADVTAVGTVMIPAMRRSGQDPADGVALLAASAIMAETIPPCINMIILGYVANISIGGLFAAGLVPAGFMALVLIGGVLLMSSKAKPAALEPTGRTLKQLIWSGIVSLGVIVIIFGGYRSGFATATEVAAFAVFYAIAVGALVFRELTIAKTAKLFVGAATLSGMILFVVAASQTVAFVLTIDQVPQGLAHALIALSHSHGGGSWIFMLVSIALLIIMGAALEGAPALIIFGPLLLPVAQQFGFDPLHYGIVLIVAMGIGLFAPPLGLGLYTSCAVGGVPIEQTAKPIAKYLLLMLACLLVLAFVPEMTLAVPRAMGFIK